LAEKEKVVGQTVSDTSQGATPVPAELLAQLKATKVAIADPTQDGHGVTAHNISINAHGRT
jgi:hypothetical protein